MSTPRANVVLGILVLVLAYKLPGFFHGSGQPPVRAAEVVAEQVRSSSSHRLNDIPKPVIEASSSARPPTREPSHQGPGSTVFGTRWGSIVQDLLDAYETRGHFVRPRIARILLELEGVDRCDSIRRDDLRRALGSRILESDHHQRLETLDFALFWYEEMSSHPILDTLITALMKVEDEDLHQIRRSIFARAKKRKQEAFAENPAAVLAALNDWTHPARLVGALAFINSGDAIQIPGVVRALHEIVFSDLPSEIRSKALFRFFHDPERGGTSFLFDILAGIRDVAVMNTAVRLLSGLVGGEVSSLLVTILSEPDLPGDEDDVARRFAIHGLARQRSNPDITHALLLAYDSETDVSSRISVLAAMKSHAGQAPIGEKLLQLVENGESPNERAEAALSLANADLPQVVETLAQVARDDPSLVVRKAARLALENYESAHSG